VEPELGIRVMSYNIAAGHGDLSRIADVIRGSGAELVALQEVDVHWGDRSQFVDQARWLADALDMEVAFAPIYSLPPATGAVGRREFGLAMLSQHPLMSAENHEITRLSTQSADAVPEPLPGFQEVIVEVMGRRVTVFNTHLDYRSDPAVRRLQVADMLRLIGQAARPVLLLGDLNAEPGAPELLPLFQRLSDVWPRTGDPGLTYPAEGPTKRIDYILSSEHFRTVRASVLDTDASDHRPVVAELMTRPGF
jgi:endonuclease/exonuclease/phosphatase family metal-dependent hydrolase